MTLLAARLCWAYLAFALVSTSVYGLCWTNVKFGFCGFVGSVGPMLALALLALSALLVLLCLLC